MMRTRPLETSLALSEYPLISVVMPVYNAEQYVAEAITSILCQSYGHFELIVVDDGSTDRSAAVVREFAARDSRICPVFLQHQGQAAALNIGIAKAAGEFVAHMEQDDVALPDRLASQLNWMRQTEVDICGGQLKRFGDHGEIVWFPERHDAIRHELLFRPALHHGSSMVRSSIAKTEPFNESVTFLDYEMMTRLALRYRLGNVPRILVKWRSHAKQTHIVQQSAFNADVDRLRRSYFHALFPSARVEDYVAIVFADEHKPCLDLECLERAGRWLVRLSETPDAFLRRRMLGRWHTICRQSAHLGMESYRTYREFSRRFGVEPVSSWDFPLRLVCALRLKSDSRTYALLASVKRRLPRGRRS